MKRALTYAIVFVLGVIVGAVLFAGPGVKLDNNFDKIQTQLK